VEVMNLVLALPITWCPWKGKYLLFGSVNHTHELAERRRLSLVTMTTAPTAAALKSNTSSSPVADRQCTGYGCVIQYLDIAKL